MAVNRYNKYTEALKNDHEFQKRFMLPVEVTISKKKTITIDADEGVTPCTAEGLAKLKTKPGCVVTFGAQTILPTAMPACLSPPEKRPMSSRLTRP